MIPYGRGICYSGYRKNETPVKGIYPTYEEVLEDLRILEPYYDYLRMYDVSPYALTVLDVIEKEKLPFKVMLGVEPGGEISNPNCPWGGLHSEEEIIRNHERNFFQLDKLAAIANRYKDIVLAVSVGNECTSDWHPNLMPSEVMAEHVRYVKKLTDIPVTFCEGAYFWRTKGAPIAKEVDFISIHCYPAWMDVLLKDAFDYTVQNYTDTVSIYPDKQIIFTEFGWPTSAVSSMNVTQIGETQQKEYLSAMAKWEKDNKITMFVFEAFDELWKGGNDPDEQEKHWGLWTVDRISKLYQSGR
ncbi:MAG TPA: glycosyl hydrolase family 17 protein [Bacillota bacterium]|nr:glycosyl hydrolase family 17 protein [Bacillota bacterium]